MSANPSITRESSLSKNSRKEVMAQLFPLLCSTMDLHGATKLAHWQVRGHQFFTLHQAFDIVAEQTSGWADDIAERLMATGATLPLSSQHMTEHSVLPNWDPKSLPANALVEPFADRLALFSQILSVAANRCEEASDHVTADLLTRITEASEKNLWMFNAYLG